MDDGIPEPEMEFVSEEDPIKRFKRKMAKKLAKLYSTETTDRNSFWETNAIAAEELAEACGLKRLMKEELKKLPDVREFRVTKVEEGTVKVYARNARHAESIVLGGHQRPHGTRVCCTADKPGSKVKPRKPRKPKTS